MEQLKNAREMYEYCRNNNFGQGMSKSWSEKHFQVIVDALTPDEAVLMVFIGLHNYVSVTKHDQNVAYAITNKRIIMGQKKLIGNVVQSVSLDQVNDITSSTGMLLTVITIDTIKEKFNVAVNKIVGQNITDKIHALLIELKSPAEAHSTGRSAADEISKLKDLLDQGALTQEEFDAMKKKMLGL